MITVSVWLGVSYQWVEAMRLSGDDAARVWLRAVEPSCAYTWDETIDEYEHYEHECLRAPDHDGMHVCRCGLVTSP